MSTSNPQATTAAGSTERVRRIGLLVHPTRNVDEPLRLLREWTEEHGVDVAQIAASYPQRRVADEATRATPT